ncbi:MAG TPA: prolyl oligopeptidase family serine peptidase [Planctomycetota bacterium]|nr:prolyl oligopeptidase family serine peptidase [Planctomycetota bacterium]
MPRPAGAAVSPPALVYPKAARGDVVEDYHGTQVADPYRWLEDPDSPETRAWVEAENKITFDFLERIPERTELKKRLTELWDFERFGLPQSGKGHYAWSRNDGLQPQSVIYTSEGAKGEPRVLLDPNTLSKDGTVALSSMNLSDDGRYLAYGVADGGSDWNIWHVREVATGVDLEDTLRWVKFSSPAWMPDASGFYYGRYAAPAEGAELEAVNYDQKLYFHKLGTAQDADTLVYERPDHKDWGFGAIVTEDSRYLVLDVWQGTDERNRVFYRDLSEPNSAFVEFLNDFDADYTFLGNDGPLFWFNTNLDAPRGRVIAIDTRNPARSEWKDVIPQSADTLASVSLVGDHFIGSYLKDARSVVRVFDLSGKPLRDVELPGLGTAEGFGGKRSDPETFYAYDSFTSPSAVYRYDIASGQSEIFRAPKLVFDPAAYMTEQVFCTSKDGTRVPIFLTYKKGLERNGQNPTLLYAYGGFNQSMTPTFRPARIAWMERGGIFAVANLRGGGEYGEEWHAAGTKLKKQNVFDDFIAASEWLIAQKYTSTSKLAIQGGSNGGLLIGAVIAQRPELFGAALPAVGVMDMLRFHKFTIGWAWTSDYGSSEDPEEFKALHAYSPYHNLRAGTCYPPTMVTTADHDDRVVPAHSFKFTAELQHDQACRNPTLIRIDVRAGHGAGKPTAKLIDQYADEMAFTLSALGESRAR